MTSLFSLRLQPVFYGYGLLVVLLGWACQVAAQQLPSAKVSFKGSTFLVEVVEYPERQSKGLGGRRHLGPQEGMLFLYQKHGEYRFWMKDMRIPIDIIWLDNGRVVHIAHRVPPPKPATPLSALSVYQPPQPANLVLEIAAGRAKSLGLKPGDYLQIRF